MLPSTKTSTIEPDDTTVSISLAVIMGKIQAGESFKRKAKIEI
jgi:hypothetical protein